MPLVFFEREGKTVNTNSGWKLRKLAQKNGVEVYKGINKLINCRGNGMCGTCMMEVYPNKAGDVNPRTAMEEKKLKKYTNPHLRLSCQVVVHGNIRVKTQPVEFDVRNESIVPPPLVAG